MVSTATGDDVGQAGIPIGFTFNYLGTPYTTLDVNTNGGMALGASGLAGSAANANMFLTGTPSAAIHPGSACKSSRTTATSSAYSANAAMHCCMS